jgi:hypothetical protein
MTQQDQARVRELATVGAAMHAHDPIEWHCLTELRKWHDPDDGIHLLRPEDELVIVEGNLLVYGGASAQWQTLIGGSAGVTLFNNANARIGVGDSATATTATMIDLQAATNKFRALMDATYPLHTDSSATAASNTCTFRSTFANAEANFTWNEWGVFNGALTTGAAAGGRMLNRAVQALGAKTSGSWQLTVTLSLA